jgi:hypothetical protein
MSLRKRALLLNFSHLRRPYPSGFVLVSILILSLAFSLLILTLGSTSYEGLSVSRGQARSTSGFFAAEAGINKRYDDIRNDFFQFRIPSGTEPSPNGGCGPKGLSGGGSGAFNCQVVTLGPTRATTFVRPYKDNPTTIRVPSGERFEGLLAYDYRYTIESTAYSVIAQEKEAYLQVLMRNRAIPLFQFAAFYGKDLDYFNGPPMVINGPVHTNGDLYIDTDTSLHFLGSVTAAGKLIRGQKHQQSCLAGQVSGTSAYGAKIPFSSCSSRSFVTQQKIDEFAGSVRQGLAPPILPSVEIVKPSAGGIYWDKADLRLVVDINKWGVPDDRLVPVKIVDRKGTVDVSRSNYLAACQGQIKRVPPDAYDPCKQCGPPATPGLIPPLNPGSGPSTGSHNLLDTPSTDGPNNPLRQWFHLASFTQKPQNLSTSEKIGGEDSTFGAFDASIFPTLPGTSPNIDTCGEIWLSKDWPSSAVSYRPPNSSGAHGSAQHCCAGWCNTTIYGPTYTDSRSECNSDPDKRFSSMEIDLQGVLTCIQKSIDEGKSLLEESGTLDDTSDNGLVFYMTIRGDQSNDPHNLYTIMLGHAETIQALPSVRKELVKGLTVVSDQSVHLVGNYNVPKDEALSVAAAVVADKIHILSERVCYNPTDTGYCNSSAPDLFGGRWINYSRLFYEYPHTASERMADDTSVRAAFLVGSDTAGGVEGPAGQDKKFVSSSYSNGIPWMSGGLQNVMHFHENWKGKAFNYTGSIVSLWKAQHYNAPYLMPGPYTCGGKGRASVYEAPDRNWKWDEKFSRPENLPPLTPLLNYVQQEALERKYQ